MKLRTAVAAVFLLGALCGCSNNSTTTSYLYTPAPVTPRPTFDTTRYRTKEEINAKVDEDFVISSQSIDQGYPSKESEYYTEFTENIDKNIKSSVNNHLNSSVTKADVDNMISDIKNTDFDNASGSLVSYFPSNTNTVTFTTPTPATPSPTQRPADFVPDSFSSTNYPYSLYSYDGRTYLGEVTLSQNNTKSIWNTDGSYGSSDSLTSIFNSYGIYGSKNSMFSAFNDDASSPPIIFDSKGNYLGRLSENTDFADSVTLDALKVFAEKNSL